MEGCLETYKDQDIQLAHLSVLDYTATLPEELMVQFTEETPLATGLQSIEASMEVTLGANTR